MSRELSKEEKKSIKFLVKNGLYSEEVLEESGYKQLKSFFTFLIDILRNKKLSILVKKYDKKAIEFLLETETLDVNEIFNSPGNQKLKKVIMEILTEKLFERGYKLRPIEELKIGYLVSGIYWEREESPWDNITRERLKNFNYKEFFNIVDGYLERWGG